MAYNADGLRSFAFGGILGTNSVSTTTGQVSSFAQKKLWHYVTNDADTVVEADGYFDATGIGPGDLVFCSLDIDGTDEVKIYVATGTIADVGLTAMLIA